MSTVDVRDAPADAVCQCTEHRSRQTLAGGSVVVEVAIEKCGLFALIEDKQGFRWELTTPAGGRWCWDPLMWHWTGKGNWSRTPAAASVGLDWLWADQAAGP
jgi:hypothetical protein